MLEKTFLFVISVLTGLNCREDDEEFTAGNHTVEEISGRI